MAFSKIHCANCPLKKHCPAKRKPNGTRELRTSVKEHVLARRRRYEKTDEFRKRYAARAGIEATNSELKRAHGLGFLRVRGGARVKLSVYFKALACNVKRVLGYLAKQAQKAARAAEKAAAEATPTAPGPFLVGYESPRALARLNSAHPLPNTVRMTFSKAA